VQDDERSHMLQLYCYTECSESFGFKFTFLLPLIYST